MTRQDIVAEGWEIHPNLSDILVKDGKWCLYGIHLGLRREPQRLRILDTINDFILYDGYCESIIEFKKICKKLKI